MLLINSTLSFYLQKSDQKREPERVEWNVVDVTQALITIKVTYNQSVRVSNT